MSYTPPAFNAVDFDDGGEAYTPPNWNVVDFDDAEITVTYLPWIMFFGTTPQ